MDFEEAKKILSNSGKAGRIVMVNNSWEIEYLPQRQKEFEIKKKAAEEENIRRKKEEIMEKERLEKQERLFKQRKELEKREKEREREEYFAYKNRTEVIEKKKEQKRLEKQRQIELREENIREKIRDKFFDARIIMQYKRAGSGGRNNQFSEWGCWIILRDGIYIASHESNDRVDIAKKSKTKPFKDKKDAIKYCKWLIDHYWYSDTRFFKGENDFDDFPITKPLTDEERDKAADNFIPYRELQPEEEPNPF